MSVEHRYYLRGKIEKLQAKLKKSLKINEELIEEIHKADTETMQKSLRI